MKRRHIIRSWLVMLTIALALVTLSPAAYAASKVTPSSAKPATASLSYQLNSPVARPLSPEAYAAIKGAIFFDVSKMPLHLLRPTYYMIVGQMEHGQYHYQYELVAAHGTFASEIEVATNPITHTELLEVGVPTSSSLAAIPAMPNTNTHSAIGMVDRKALFQRQSLVALHSSSSGWYYTAWYDPIGLVLTEVKDTINYSYDGFYVDSFSGSDWRNWGVDGWSETYHSIGSFYNSNHTSATVWTEDYFENSVFCAGNATYIYYSDNYVVANGNGGIGGYKDTWDSGGCSTWLHPASTVGGGA